MTSLVWFRQDLRVADNPALAHAAKQGEVACLYVLDETEDSQGRPIGAASRWWLHHSLKRLEKSLGGLILLRGDPREILPEVAKKIGADGVYWNRCYEPYAIGRDTALKSRLSDDGLDVKSFNGSLLFEPWEIETQSGEPYKVYSAFWRACLKLKVEAPTRAVKLDAANCKGVGDQLDDWKLLPTKPNWAKGFEEEWHPGEEGAKQRLEAFLDQGLEGYGELRNRPDLPNVSRLSPHLHFGEISPRQIWSATKLATDAEPRLSKDGSKFLSEIGWREFSHHLIYHFPKMATENWRSEFDAFPWVKSGDELKAWQRGQTGYPIVDAGMRELWTTGYMHNRVRMIVASFLIKDLRIHWREGEAWFWDTLVDADLANNVAGWQWVAGSGADAAPYFRIFNPVTQGKKFDPNGDYVRRWCPEIAKLPDAHLHAPFEAPPEVLEEAGVALGKTYPQPMVDHAKAREAALQGYERVKNSD